MNHHTHAKYLRKALLLAAIRKGFCAPNPAVGALVIKDDEILATGYHMATGMPHAEAEALQQLGDEAKGATLYVTLEPCCHWGKTPPCTDLLIQRGIAHVIYGFADPNPEVAGKSKQQLEEAGIRYEHCPLPEIDEFYCSYVFWQRAQRPMVRAKMAISLDGKIAAAHGHPVKISGDEADRFTQQRRKLADAILTTITTIKNDDPKLNVRFTDRQYVKPIYILDSHLSLPLTAQVIETARKITVFHDHHVTEKQCEAYRAKGIRCMAVDTGPTGLDLKQVLAQIGQDGCHDLWVEVGSKCFQSLATASLIQRAYLYVAAKCLGSKAYSAFHNSELLFKDIKNFSWRVLGEDAVCEMRW